MTDIAVIILTKDVKLHIGRCLERIAALSLRQTLSSTASPPAWDTTIITK